jgi:hypothetical protein
MPPDSSYIPPDEPHEPPIEGEVVRSRRIAEFGRAAARAQVSRPRPGMPGRPLPPQSPGYDQPFLRNPYVLAGFAVAGGILLAVIAVIAFRGGGGPGGGDNSGVFVNPLTPQPGQGFPSRSVAQATVREGPGLDYLAIGELSRNQDVEIAGRNQDGTWYNIYFPPNTPLRGWVPASALRLPSNTAAIPVVSVTPIPRPTVIQPTAPPEPTQSPTETPTATPSGTPAGGSDLAASIVPGTCAVGTRLIVNVKNLGPAPVVSRAIAVLVQAPDGTQRALAAQTASIPPGGQIDIDTTYVVQERVIATVDPLGTIGDPNPSNNRVDCVVSVVPTQPGGATPTRTPTVAVPPPAGASLTPLP